MMVNKLAHAEFEYKTVYDCFMYSIQLTKQSEFDVFGNNYRLPNTPRFAIVSVDKINADTYNYYAIYINAQPIKPGVVELLQDHTVRCRNAQLPHGFSKCMPL